MSLEDAPSPVPGPDEVIVRQHTIGVNFSDVQARRGGSVYARRPLPYCPGVEGAGRVISVGSAVRDVSPGQLVTYFGTFGIYAEEVAVPSNRVVILPEGLPPDVAATVLSQGVTAHILAHDVVPTLGAGDVALVVAGGAGVGFLLVQLLVGLGLRVIATASTDGKAKYAREAGARHVIVPADGPVDQRVHDLTDGTRVGVVFDGVGRSTFNTSLRCLRPRGYLVMFGEASGPPELFSPAELGHAGSLYLTRMLMTDYQGDVATKRAREQAVLAMAASGMLKVRVHRRYPFADAGAALDEVEARGTSGKVLLMV